MPYCNCKDGSTANCECEGDVCIFIERLDSIRDELVTLVTNFPHYALFVKHMYLEPAAEDAKCLALYLKKTEERRVKALRCKECNEEARD